MYTEEWLDQCVKGGPWWANNVVEAIRAIRAGNGQEAEEWLEDLLPSNECLPNCDGECCTGEE